MARVDGFNLPPEYDETFFRDIRWGNEFVNKRLIMKERPLSRAQKTLVVDTSVLPEVAALWSGLTDEQRQAWTAAGVYSGQSGYNLFVQDTSYRIKNGLSGVATPSEYHQFKVGSVIMSPADTFSAAFQFHSSSYYVPRRIIGTEDRWEPVLVSETIPSYFQISFSMFSDLVSDSPSSFFRFAVVIYWQDGEESGETALYADLPLVTDWTRKTFYISYDFHPIVGYAPGFLLSRLTGSFLFDNVSMVHSGQNWAIDSNCNEIEGFPRNLGVPVVVPWFEGGISGYSPFVSIYPPD